MKLLFRKLPGSIKLLGSFKLPVLAISLLVLSAWRSPSAFGAEPTAWPEFSFVTASDIHFVSQELFDPDSRSFSSILETSEALMVAESAEITREFINDLANDDARTRADFLLITGDLTLNGERESHLELASLLRLAEASGTEVYVLPGNHDIMNPFAARFTGKKYELTESITPKEFADIYNPFGYQEAIYRHTETLSYAAEPVEGVWLVAVDTNTYLSNQDSGYPWSSGEIGIDLYYWLEEILGYAKEKGKKVIAAMHHPVIDPIAPRGTWSFVDTLNKADHVIDFLIRHQVRVVFTGHNHACNITSAEWNNGTLYDVATGSLAVFPHRYRRIEVAAEAAGSAAASLGSEETGPTEATGSAAAMRFAVDEITALPSYTAAGRDFYSESWKLAVYRNADILAERLKRVQGVPLEDAYLMAEYKGLLEVLYLGGNDSEQERVREIDWHPGVLLWKQYNQGRDADEVRLMSRDLAPADSSTSIPLF